MAAGSTQQLGEWLDQFGPSLVLYAQQLCGSPEDVVQEAFVELLRLRRLPENVRAWLYRVVRHRALNAARAAARRRSHEAAVAGASRAWFEETPGHTLDARTAAAALEELERDQREVVVARVWGGLSFPEIGELTQTSTATAYRRYQAGLEALRERLGETNRMEFRSNPSPSGEHSGEPCPVTSSTRPK